MKYLLLFLLPVLLFSEAKEISPEDVDKAHELVIEEEAVAREEAAKDDEKSDEVVKVKDTSGKTEDEVREIAKELDKKDDEKQVKIKDVVDAIDEKGNVKLKDIQKPWEELSPKAEKFDWVQTKSGEWFKGEFIAMYDDNLEFDSDEIGLYEFDFEDIKQIKSYHMMSVNIEDVATFDGLLRFKDDKMTIIQGDKKYTFPREQIVSIGPTAEKERNLWSGKITLSADIRTGNKDESDYAANVDLKRRTDKTRLRLTYLGRVSKKDGDTTSDDHRINEKYDRYLTRRFFWTPVFSEYYKDRFQNINHQITAGTGIGYTFIDTKKIEWDVSTGPAIIRTNYISVDDGEDTTITSPAWEVSTHLDIELNKISDFALDHRMTLTDNKSGTYKHHMVATLENEITSWIDLDISFIWDHINSPEEESDGTLPDKNDYQLLIGFGVEF
jgi:putative salt-induced outer membrane protein YdiY